jgi:molybdopterin/thiamine biosynthesis adenylyltransferase
MNDMFFSRERAAGYDPTVLDKATVTLVGTGALGQNLAMNFNMSQVGSQLLIDHDQWEPHNATRSICYPNDDDRKQWGNSKAAVVAHKLRQSITWPSRSRIYYATKPIQALGDAPFRNTSVVVSAVDNQAARDYLGFKAAQFGLPLIEGGFSGPRVNSTILLNDNPKAPCWHCNIYGDQDKNKAVQLSCTKVARQAEEAGFIPAIQSAAAYLAALMTEATIQLLHGNTQLGNRQIFMDIRAATSTVAELQFNSRCRRHASHHDIDFKLGLPSDATCKDLLAALEEHIAKPIVHLPFSFVVRVGCAECKRPISVSEPEWIMAELLFCNDCGGKWERTNKPGNEVYTTLSNEIEPLLDLPIDKVGLVPGSLIAANNDTQDTMFELVADSKLPFFTLVQENSDVPKFP